MRYASIMTEQIELTDIETALYVQVSEAERLLLVDHDHNRARKAGEASSQLFRLLLGRNAIPESRRRYFADRTYNSSDTRASRRDRFLRNARSEDAMYEHPHFWKYLIYFINGADLPQEVVEEFAQISKDEMRDYNALSSFARRTSRQVPGDHGTKAEEFFKLAIDCGCPLNEANGIRRAVMQVR